MGAVLQVYSKMGETMIDFFISQNHRWSVFASKSHGERMREREGGRGGEREPSISNSTHHCPRVVVVVVVVVVLQVS